MTVPRCLLAPVSTVFSLVSTCFFGKSCTVTVTGTSFCASWASSTIVSSLSSRRTLGVMIEYLCEEYRSRCHLKAADSSPHLSVPCCGGLSVLAARTDVWIHVPPQGPSPPSLSLPLSHWKLAFPGFSTWLAGASALSPSYTQPLLTLLFGDRVLLNCPS